LETWRLKRRRADSIPSFSPTVTWVMKGCVNANSQAT
jgi:hypothetical protein